MAAWAPACLRARPPRVPRRPRPRARPPPTRHAERRSLGRAGTSARREFFELFQLKAKASNTREDAPGGIDSARNRFLEICQAEGGIAPLPLLIGNGSHHRLRIELLNFNMFGPSTRHHKKGLRGARS